MNTWQDYVDLPQSDAGTPLNLRHMASEHPLNDKKRGPSTPLTPSLIQRNILKKQVMEHQRRIEEERKVVPLIHHSKEASFIEGSSALQYSDGSALEGGSPKSRRVSVEPLKEMSPYAKNLTPRIATGIKQAVRDNKKSRLQILRTSHKDDISFSDGEYSEMSTISGETPNYKFKENLIYYKNGYYVDNSEDYFAEIERSNIINEHELTRMGSLMEFMKLERQFELESGAAN